MTPYEIEYDLEGSGFFKLHEFYLAADVDALLRKREESLSLLEHEGIQITASLMVEQRAQDGLDGQSALDMLNNQLAALTAERDQLKFDYYGLLTECDRVKIERDQALKRLEEG